MSEHAEVSEARDFDKHRAVGVVFLEGPATRQLI